MYGGRRRMMTIGFALAAATAQAGNADATNRALDQLNASMQQLNRQL